MGILVTGLNWPNLLFGQCKRCLPKINSDSARPGPCRRFMCVPSMEAVSQIEQRLS